MIRPAGVESQASRHERYSIFILLGAPERPLAVLDSCRRLFLSAPDLTSNQRCPCDMYPVRDSTDHKHDNTNLKRGALTRRFFYLNSESLSCHLRLTDLEVKRLKVFVRNIYFYFIQLLEPIFLVLNTRFCIGNFTLSVML